MSPPAPDPAGGTRTAPAAPAPDGPAPVGSMRPPRMGAGAAPAGQVGHSDRAGAPPAAEGAAPDPRPAETARAPGLAGEGGPTASNATFPKSVRGRTAPASATGPRKEAGRGQDERRAAAGGKRHASPQQASGADGRRTARIGPQTRPATPKSGSARPTPPTADAPGFDPAESPLVWLARRAGKNGRPLVDATQLTAGERLRADFTRAALTPRVTSRWSEVSGSGSPETFSDMVLAAKLRVSRALAAVGPELSGVLLDVCCFLKGLETVERERGWPARTAKVVLGLALDRLATHYGLARATEGRARAPMRAWQAPDA